MASISAGYSSTPKKTFGNMVRNNAADDYKKKLQTKIEDISNRKTADGKISDMSTGRTGGGAQFAVNGQNSVFKNSTLQTKDGKAAYSVSDFANLWTAGAAEEMSETQLKALQAQNELLASLADEDGDGNITEEEAKILDVVGDDGVITDEDIAKIYESLDLLEDDASLGDLLDAVGSILGIENEEEAEEAVEEVGISLDHTGVKKNDDGTYEVEVEKYRGGKVQQDGDVMRYPNGTYWGIVTNAYPDLKESEKEQVYNAISEMNDFDWNTHVLQPGETIKMPVITRDADGNLQFSEKMPEKEEEKVVDEKFAVPEDGKLETSQGAIEKDDEGKYSITLTNGVKVDCEYDEETGKVSIPGAEQSEKPGTYGYSYTIKTEDGQTVSVEPYQGKYYINGTLAEGVKLNDEGELEFQANPLEKAEEQEQKVDHHIPNKYHGSLETREGLITCDMGKFYMNGMSCKYDEETGEVTIAAQKSDKPGSYGYSYTLPDGQVLEPHMGKYYISGAEVKIKYDEENGTVSFVTTPGERILNNEQLQERRDAKTGQDKDDKAPADKAAEHTENYENVLKYLEDAPDKEKIDYLNTMFQQDYGLTFAEKGELISKFISYQDEASSSDLELLAENMTGLLITGMTDEEFLEFGKAFADACQGEKYKNLSQFMEEYAGNDNSVDKVIYANRIIDLYTNAGENMEEVLKVFSSDESIQFILRGDKEDGMIKDLIGAVGGKIDYPGGDINVDKAIKEFNDGELSLWSVLNSDYTDAQKGYILSKVSPEKVVDGLDDMSYDDQEKYLKTLLLDFGAATADAKKADGKNDDSQYLQFLKDIKNASPSERVNYLNTILEGDYNLTAEEKGKLVTRFIADYGDAYSDDITQLAENIVNLVPWMTDEEFLAFAKDFEQNNTYSDMSLSEFIEEYAGSDNTVYKNCYVNRVGRLYANAGPNMQDVLKVFPSKDSVQYLLSGKHEDEMVKGIISDVSQNVKYPGGNMNVDNALRQVQKGDMSLKELLNSSSLSDEEKGYVLAQLGPDKVSEALVDMSTGNEEKYFEQILLKLGAATKA